jgi:hypothetical protein
MIERTDGLEGKAIMLYLTRTAPVKKKEVAPASSTVPVSPSVSPAKTD